MKYPWVWKFVALGIAAWLGWEGWKLIEYGHPVTLALGIAIIVMGSGTLVALVAATGIGDSAGQRFSNLFFYRVEKLKKAPERIARVQGLIAEEQWDEAEVDLLEILERNPVDAEACLLLAQLYYDYVGDRQKAVAELRRFLTHPKHESGRDTVQMLLLYTDWVSSQEAVDCLKSELKRGKFATADRKLLENRIQALS